MQKEKIKKLLGFIIWSDFIPEELKNESLKLIINNLDKNKLLEELLRKFEKKSEVENISFVRKIN